ncbi:MAG: hypothetical protein JWP52_697, partial [Rhizobacter sp.]|nr:hypothetical protein [Rhizobacter sp.]
VLRPILVGKDTKLPDYVVLISTLGGMALFGINGFVIGPVIAAMFMAVWTIFSLSRNSVSEPVATSVGEPAASPAEHAVAVADLDEAARRGGKVQDVPAPPKTPVGG